METYIFWTVFGAIWISLGVLGSGLCTGILDFSDFHFPREGDYKSDLKEFYGLIWAGPVIFVVALLLCVAVKKFQFVYPNKKGRKE